VELHGITISRQEARLASRYFKKITVTDVETARLRYPRGYFDALVLSHVLEHTVNPKAVLRRLKMHLRAGGRCYIALPNFAYYKNRFEVFLGRFTYQEGGIMDRTHLRFYTFETAVALVQSAGLHVVMAKGVGSFPLWPIRTLVGADTWVDRLAVKLFPNLFGCHLLVVATKGISPN
jgi:2-polyprenyl-3-methyl-5-hydroxy-6-metoxy-1,4-benzoquinol methylase